jgi:hypothetical protein
MKNKKIIIYFLFVSSICSCQTNTNSKYINSFPQEVSKTILEFSQIVYFDNPMTKEESLKYVYNGDSSRLYCIQKKINQETELNEGFTKELYLPSKCMRIKTDNYIIVANSSYTCNDPNDLVRIQLILSIFDLNYNKTDQLVALQESDNDVEISGILNNVNQKLFVLIFPSNTLSQSATIYEIDGHTLKFTPVRKSIEYNQNTEDLMKVLDSLGWKEFFLN